MEWLTRRRPTSRAQKVWPTKPWRHRPAAHLRITPKVRCCVRRPKCCASRADASKLFLNTRRRSRSIAIWCSQYAALGWCKFLTGSIDEVIPLDEQAIRLSPRDPAIGIWYQWIGHVHLLQSRADEAIVWLEKARSANPAHPLIRANGSPLPMRLKGETERAAAELAEARRLSSDDRFSSIARLKAAQYFGSAGRSAPCTKPLISSACARRECRRSEADRSSGIRSPQSHCMFANWWR